MRDDSLRCEKNGIQLRTGVLICRTNSRSYGLITEEYCLSNFTSPFNRSFLVC